MHNDLTTVEPSISVTAVSIADYNCFQSPCSDLLVGFFPLCQKFRKFRLRNKMELCFRPCGNFLVKAQAVQTLWEFVGL